MRAEWESTHPPPRSEGDWEAYARQYTTQVEHWLDEGYGACHFSARRWTEDLCDRLHYFHNERYLLFFWAILPNHCHLVIRPLESHALEALIGAMKGVTARHIQLAMGTTGALWEEECYDRIIRDEEHLWRIVQYIGRNPRTAGRVSENHWRRWIHPEWEAVGWKFIDDQ